MPINKGLAAGARIHYLDGLLRHGRWWSRAQLLAAINRYLEDNYRSTIGETTLRMDLAEIAAVAGDELLQDQQARNKVLYKYANRNYSVYQAPPLAAEDYDTLQQAIRLLDQIAFTEVASHLKDTIARLRYTPAPDADGPLVVYDTPPSVLNPTLMQDLYQAVSQQMVIKFNYQPFDEPAPFQIILHPYLLKEYNNRWYVIGYSEDHKAIRVCALDRFASEPIVQARKKSIDKATLNFNPTAYFADVIGPTVRQEHAVEEVVLHFTAHRAKYVITKPLHNSQQPLTAEQVPEGWVGFSYCLRFNQELLALLLSFGPDVVVVTPTHLAQKVKAAAQSIITHYENPQ